MASKSRPATLGGVSSGETLSRFCPVLPVGPGISICILYASRASLVLLVMRCAASSRSGR